MKPLFACLVLLLFLPGAQAHYTLAGPSGGAPGYLGTVSFDREPPVAYEPDNLYIQLFNANAGRPINESDLDVVHERKLHVFIVGQDLQTFYHVHPEDFPDGFIDQAQGKYKIGNTFPAPGRYAIAFDYTTYGKNVMAMIPVDVLGQGENLPPPSRDFSRTKSFGDYTVALRAPEHIIAGNDTLFSYYITENGTNVTDLQMYLGAETHVFVVRSDFGVAGHTHAYSPGHEMLVGAMQQRYAGPVVPVQFNFPLPGNYSIFAQFGHDNKVLTTQFMVSVEPPAPPPAHTSRLWLLIAGLFAIGATAFALGKREREKRKNGTL